MDKLTINGDWYIDLDEILNISSCPASLDAGLINNFDMIRHYCNINTSDLSGNSIADTSDIFAGTPMKKAATNKDIFAAELTNALRSPYHVMQLTTGGHDGYVYDSIKTPAAVWDSIKWKPGLSEDWQPFKEWIAQLPITKVGHVGVFINRPGVIPWYHVDSGQDHDLANWCPVPHREEFIWINFDNNKTFYILDNNNTPVKVQSRSAFFNTNNYHGSHESTHSWSYSVRIECIFSDEFRQQLGIQNIEGYYYEKSTQ